MLCNLIIVLRGVDSLNPFKGCYIELMVATSLNICILLISYTHPETVPRGAQYIVNSVYGNNISFFISGLHRMLHLFECNKTLAMMFTPFSLRLYRVDKY